MSANKKFQIKKIGRKKKFKNAAPIVINSKLKKVLKEINNYQTNESVENLHDLRIAFRRLRYSLEIFARCFEEQLFENLYMHTKNMQDLLGSVRDLDVMEEKARLFEKTEDIPIPETLYNKINQEKKEISATIKIELIKFVQDKEIDHFLTK